jgi:hypothetical protein
MGRLRLILLLLALASCSSTSSTTASTATTMAKPRATATTAPATTLKPRERTITVGRSWNDGVQMTLLRLNRDAPRSRSAAGGRPSDQTVVINVTVANNSNRPLDLRISLELAYGSAGRKAKAVTDPSKGYTGISPSTLRPAGRAKGQFAFAIPRGRAIQLVFTGKPGIGYESQTWEFQDP